MGWWELLAWLKSEGWGGGDQCFTAVTCDPILGLLHGNVSLIQNDPNCLETISTEDTWTNPPFLLWRHGAADPMDTPSAHLPLHHAGRSEGMCVWLESCSLPGTPMETFLQQGMDRQGMAFPSHILAASKAWMALGILFSSALIPFRPRPALLNKPAAGRE